MSLPVVAIRGATAAVVLASFGVTYVALDRRQATPEEAPASCCAVDPAPADAAPAPASTPDPAGPVESSPIAVPDAEVLDQDGRPLRFYTDLVKGRTVAIHFIFTTCQGICPPLGAAFGQLQGTLKGRGVRLISVSVDPANDTPERLKAWAARFGAGPDWTLVTGRKQDVDGLLRALGAFSTDKANHSPLLLIGDDRAGAWQRVHGLTAPDRVAAALDGLAAKAAGPAPAPEASEDGPDSAARRYFTDVPLVDQSGKAERLYTDLIRGKVVAIHVFFGSCKNTCPVMLSTFRRLQDHLGDRLGRDVHLLSITVDPDNDDVAALRDHAGRLGARPGWFLLTGSKPDLRLALGKLGLSAERPEEHSNIFIIGNDKTHLWKKVRGLATAEQTIASLDGVLADRPESGRIER